MNISILRRLRLAMLALLFVLAFASVSPTIETKTGHQFTYYNNASHTTVVGVWIICANGTSFHSGQFSPYYTISPSGC
ncbi:MAG TPA: hypothetical protein VI636_14425 [Candidatus Angelobacter sp.]